MDYLELINAQKAKAAHAYKILLYIYVNLLLFVTLFNFNSMVHCLS